jgi:AcrR family transcriptional regulator
MEHGDTTVKRRIYRSEIRRQRADQTRERVVNAAAELFLRDGYPATTIAAVAAVAGVSVETIYKGFGGKAGLVRAIWERGLAGRGAVHAEDRSDALREQGEASALIEEWSRLTSEVAPRVAPITLLVKGAAGSDAELAALDREMEADRLERMTDNARALVRIGGLRAGIGLQEVADVLWTVSSPQLYELLVLRRGWPLRRYSAFVASTMKAALRG